ncbi:class I SAM-dependent methyltransferase [Candidatus Electronema sp. JM]|uniref:class I SAM-dependent methyltransferase n=1 Tax=Candidatus Electronema sp. JM TaxID=3401571 RepID=UPI003AA7FFA4
MEPEYYIQMAAAQETHWWFSARRLIIEQMLDALKLKENSKILEIGCGTGANLKLLEKYGQVSATEIDSYALNYTRKFFHGNLRQGSLPDNTPFFGEKFDLICMFDVIEHVENDMAALSNISNFLSSNGMVFITVPAYQWLYGEHDRINHHYRRYTVGRLKKLTNNSGLRIIRAGYFNTILFPIALFLRIFERIKGGKIVSEITVPANIINKIFYRIFSAEKFILPSHSFPYGLSAFAIMEKC